MPIDGTPVDPENPSSTTDLPLMARATSRRTMLKGAAATGITAATAGVVADILFAGPASAATTTASPGGGDLVAHVRSVHAGDIDIFVGSRAVHVRDRSLAAKLARAAK
jgi:hypothetical protein